MVSYIIISIISINVGFNYYLLKLYLFADIQLALGTIFGVIITLNDRQRHQKFVKIGAISGIGGGILSSLSIGLYEMILSAIFYVPNIFVFFLFFGVSIISGIVIGLIGGAIIGTYYSYKDLKGESEKEETEDDFFDNLSK